MLFPTRAEGTSAAYNSLTVYNLNMVLQDNASTAVHFSWRTAPVSKNAAQLNCAIIYCEASQSLNTADTVTAEQQTIGGTAYYKASLTGLKPNTSYQYAVLDINSGRATSIHTFKTAPDENQAASFLCVPGANYRTTSSYKNYWGSTLNSAISKFPDAAFVMHTGSYVSTNNQIHWDGFFNLNTTAIRSIPLVPLPVYSGSANQQFAYNFNLPAKSNNTGNYSVVCGNALILALNTNLTSANDITAHVNWIKSEVETKGHGKWIIAAMGNSFYGVSSNTSTIKKTLEKTFDEVNVSLVLQGGSAVYARSHLIKNASVLDEYPAYSTFSAADGAIYLIPGSAGAEYGSVPNSASWINVTKNLSATGVKSDDVSKTYSRISITSNAIQVSAYMAGGEKIDQFEINHRPTPSAEPRPFSPVLLNSGFGADPKTTRVISWQTPSNLIDAFIEITDGAGYSATVSGVSARVSSILTGNNVHSVELKNLKPGVTYTYRLGNKYITPKLKLNLIYYSDYYQFKTEAGGAFSFIQISDAKSSDASGYVSNWARALKLIQAQDPAFILHTGNLVSSSSAANWNNFIGATGTNLGPAAFIPVSGYQESLNLNNSKFFNNVFSTKPDGAGDYSFTYGNALILTLNTGYASTAKISEHAGWLKNEAANKGKGKWIIVAMSGSFYGSAANNTAIKKTLEKVFDEIGVSLVLQGSDCAYIRSHLIKNTMVFSEYPSTSVFPTSGGIIFSSPGTVGADYKSVSSSASWIKLTRNFSGRSDKANPDLKMYSKITVSADLISVSAYTLKGELIDTFEINRLPLPTPEPKVMNYTMLNNSFGSDPKTTRIISWQTDNTMSGSFVEVTDSAVGVKKIFPGTTSKVPQYYTGSNQHKVELSGLNPGTVYQYRLGTTYLNPKAGITFTYYSETFTFTTESKTAKAFTLLHIADSQCSNVSDYTKYWGNTLEKALKKCPEAAFIIHTGDMIDAPNSSQWTSFFGGAKNNFSTPAFMPVLGNHEGKSSAVESFCKSTFSVESQNGFALNYSYTYGNALFLNLNSNYTSTSELTKQKQWIIREAADKGTGKFIIVSFHKAVYGGHHYGEDDVASIRRELVPVFEQIGVDLVLQGHDHIYTRTYPIKNGVPNTSVSGSIINTSNDGVVYMISRNSGQKTYSVPSKKSYMDILWNSPKEPSAVDDTVFSAITVKNDSIEVTAYTSDYRVIDTYKLTKNNIGTIGLSSGGQMNAFKYVTAQWLESIFPLAS